MTTLKDICERHYETWIYDCSGFLRAVGKDIGIAFIGQANDIVDAMSRFPWTSHGTDTAAAIRAAGENKLVVAGLKAKGHGHVAIVLPVDSKPPTGYWGSIAKHPGRNKTLNWAWTKTDLAKVTYYSIAIPSPIDIQ